MIPIPVVVCVLGGWCAIYLVDTLLKVRAVGAEPNGEHSAPRTPGQEPRFTPHTLPGPGGGRRQPHPRPAGARSRHRSEAAAPRPPSDTAGLATTLPPHRQREVPLPCPSRRGAASLQFKLNGRHEARPSAAARGCGALCPPSSPNRVGRCPGRPGPVGLGVGARGLPAPPSSGRAPRCFQLHSCGFGAADRRCVCPAGPASLPRAAGAGLPPRASHPAPRTWPCSPAGSPSGGAWRGWGAPARRCVRKHLPAGSRFRAYIEGTKL